MEDGSVGSKPDKQVRCIRHCPDIVGLRKAIRQWTEQCEAGY